MPNSRNDDFVDALTLGLGQLAKESARRADPVAPMWFEDGYISHPGGGNVDDADEIRNLAALL